MIDQMLEAVKKNLPAVQAEELVGFFKEYWARARKIEQLEKSLEYTKNENTRLTKIVDQERNLEDERTQLKNKIKIHEELVKQYEIIKLKDELKNAINSKEEIKSLVSTVFKNRFFNKNLCWGITENWIYKPTNSSESIMEQEMLT